MELTERDIDRLVDRVVERLSGSVGGSRAGSATASHGAPAAGVGDPGIHPSVDAATKAAQHALSHLHDVKLERRHKLVDAMRRVTLDHVDELSRMAVAETGLGRVEDKLQKNHCAATKTPGPEILEPSAFSGDEGLTLMECAPFGVIGSITPCTNATETIINNAISMVSGGNVVIFNVHPAAKNVLNYHVALINQAIMEAGGPPDCVCSVAEPTIASAQALMKHPDVRLVVVTGGGAVVRAAMQSGKRAVCAGPGNPPAVVDETADLKQAAKGVVDGCSIDNNIVCIAEKELLAVADIADRLKREILDYKAVEVKGRDLRRLEKVLITEDNHVNRDFIGKNANVIAQEIGLRLDDEVRILLCEVDKESHPFVQHEMLLPVLPMLRMPNVDEAITTAKRVEHGFRHTAVMYSRNIAALHQMAYAADCSIFVKNAPSFAGIGMGGEGYTSWTIAGATGEGLTNARVFTRRRRCVIKEYFRIV